MTGPEHYLQAEKLLDYYNTIEAGDPREAIILAVAQVHAALAQAAATADGPAVMRPEDRDDWDRATGRLS